MPQRSEGAQVRIVTSLTRRQDLCYPVISSRTHNFSNRPTMHPILVSTMRGDELTLPAGSVSRLISGLRMTRAA